MKIDLAKNPEFDNHEMVSLFEDPVTGLRGFVAIHNTTRGPAVGGTRYWLYKSENEALTDALRLSRSMTYKCALAGVPFGGGKGVIIADKKNPKTEQFLKAYAKKISLFGGNFYTGEDVGLTLEDIQHMSSASDFIIGSPKKAGDPSPWAALGVFYAMKAALHAVYGADDFVGKKISIKGIGKVGMELARLLHEAGAELFVSDIDGVKNSEITTWGARVTVVDSEKIHTLPVDIYAPCALGGELTKKKIKELACRIVCGAANNQLEHPENGKLLHKRDILYIPDYLANAGGLINVVSELEPGGYQKEKVLQKVTEIEGTAKKILDMSRETSRPPYEVADHLAQALFVQQ